MWDTIKFLAGKLCPGLTVQLLFSVQLFELGDGLDSVSIAIQCCLQLLCVLQANEL
jgi:hypothetical protein